MIDGINNMWINSVKRYRANLIRVIRMSIFAIMGILLSNKSALSQINENCGGVINNYGGLVVCNQSALGRPSYPISGEDLRSAQENLINEAKIFIAQMPTKSRQERAVKNLAKRCLRTGSSDFWGEAKYIDGCRKNSQFPPRLREILDSIATIQFRR